MADTPENEELTQEELDELSKMVEKSDPSEDLEPGVDDGAVISDAGLIADTGIELPEGFDLNEDATHAMDIEMPFPEPVAAALKMETFSDRPVKSQNPMHSFERIEDVPLELTVELGRTKLLIKDVLDLGAGSIVELEKMAGEPVDLLANGLLIARGEVVVIDDNFGVRITEVITSAARKMLAEEAADLSAA